MGDTFRPRGTLIESKAYTQNKKGEPSLKCPKCKTSDLFPVKLEEGLPAMGCKSCEGVLISLLYYRDWADRTAVEQLTQAPVPTLVEDNDTKVAIGCPKCARIMTKYQISSETSNKLNVCASCDEAWIDNGEWILLKSLGLIKKIPSIFTDPWQNRIKREISEKSRFERLVEVVGQDDAARAKEIRDWLSNNKHKASIIRYVGFE